MHVFIFNIAFVLMPGPLFAAAAPVSVPRASGLQDPRAPVTQDATITSETARAPLFGTVLNLLPTLQVREHCKELTLITGKREPDNGRKDPPDPHKNPGWREKCGDYHRGCSKPPAHSTDAHGHAAARSGYDRMIHKGEDCEAVVGDRKHNGSMRAGKHKKCPMTPNADKPPNGHSPDGHGHGAARSLDERTIHEGDDRDAALGNRKDNGSITAGNPNPPYQARGKLRDPPKNTVPHQYCGLYNRACGKPPKMDASLESRDELTIHNGDDRDAALGNRKGNGSVTAGNPTGGW